jgi:pimeloyl-ACP methyl ester carboxylesterase
LSKLWVAHMLIRAKLAVPGFVQAGYRVICPDLRGYAKSSKPSGIQRYSEVIFSYS